MDRGDQQDEGFRDEGDETEPAVIVAIYDQLASHGDMLRMILSLLQPKAPKDGPDLGKLLEALVTGINEQSGYLREISVALGKLGRELPLDLVAAIDDNLDIPRRNGAAGNGSSAS